MKDREILYEPTPLISKAHEHLTTGLITLTMSTGQSGGNVNGSTPIEQYYAHSII